MAADDNSILLFTLAGVLLIVLILAIIGLCLFFSSNSKQKQIAFAAANNPGIGSVQLNWTYNFSGWAEDPVTSDTAKTINFNLKIWYSNTNTGSPDQTLLLNSDGSNGGLQYNAPTQSGQYPDVYNYEIVLDAATYFAAGTNTMTLQSAIGTATSDPTDPAQVSVEAPVSAAATFNGSYFAACGYIDAVDPSDVSQTSTMLLWKQSVGNNGNFTASEFCYILTFTAVQGGGDLTTLGFSNGTQTLPNGITYVVDTNAQTITMTFSDSPTVTPISNSCCCIPENDQTTSLIQFSGDSNNYYVLLTSPNATNASSNSLEFQVTLSTFQSDCSTQVGDTSTANLYVAGPTTTPTITTSCNPNCSYDDKIEPYAVPTSKTVCDKTLQNNPISVQFVGGSAVTFTLSRIPNVGDFMSVLQVTENAINADDPKMNTVLSDKSSDWPITWNLPSGSYTGSCVLYVKAFESGPLIGIYNVIVSPFTINLETPDLSQPSWSPTSS